MDEKFTDCPRLNSGAVRGPSQIPCIYLSLKRCFFQFFSFIAPFSLLKGLATALLLGVALRWVSGFMSK